MARYAIRHQTCSRCANEAWLSVRLDRDEPPLCDSCNPPTYRYNSPPLSMPNFNSYYDSTLGCVVRNRDHKRELLKIHDLVEVGNDMHGVERDAERNLKHRQSLDFDRRFKDDLMRVAHEAELRSQHAE